jgi:sulfur carrier protein ThiS
VVFSVNGSIDTEDKRLFNNDKVMVIPIVGGG